MQHIAKSLARFHKEMQPVTKDRANPFFKSNYATLDAILESIKMPLQNAGLTFVQLPDGDNGLKTVIIDVESGETMEGTMRISPVKDDPQAHGSAYSYARRYSLSMMLGIATEEDDDGNAATAKPAPQQQQAGKTPAEKTCNSCGKPHSGPYATCYACHMAKKPA